MPRLAISYEINTATMEEIQVEYLDENGNISVMSFYVNKEPITITPLDAADPLYDETFWMQDKFGNRYNSSEYLLKAYIRVLIPNSRIDYGYALDMQQRNYRQSPFHPYWLGGFGVDGDPIKYLRSSGGNSNFSKSGWYRPGEPINVDPEQVVLGNRNRNAYVNLRKFMEPYAANNVVLRGSDVYPPRFELARQHIYGLATPGLLPKLSGIGEELISNVGSLKEYSDYTPYNMNQPQNMILDTDTYARFNLGATAERDTRIDSYVRCSVTNQYNNYISPTVENSIFRLSVEFPHNFTRTFNTDYNPSESRPILVPPLFVDHMCYSHRVGQERGSSGIVVPDSYIRYNLLDEPLISYFVGDLLYPTSEIPIEIRVPNSPPIYEYPIDTFSPQFKDFGAMVAVTFGVVKL